MEIRLAEKLRELRKDRGNTQEELANFIGITVQAVSKWERAEGLPDLTYLPSIAGFYHVSVDTLLGVDETAKEARINEICKEYDRIRQCPLRSDGTLIVGNNIEAGIAHIRNALHELPNCYFFMQLLASDLWFHAKSKEGEEKSALLDEAEMWCRKVLAECKEDRFRHCANEILCLILHEQGNTTQALDIAYSLPDAVGTNDYMLTMILEGSELEDQLHRSIREFLRLTYLCVQKYNEISGDAAWFRDKSELKIQLEAIEKLIVSE